MEAIKKKMQAMKAEKENAVERATEAESEAKEANGKAEKVCFSLFIVKHWSDQDLWLGWRRSSSSSKKDPTSWKWTWPGPRKSR